MKKYVSLFLALIMIFTLASCGGKTEENTTVSLPAVAAERAAVEQAGAIATQQYIIARLKTEALIEYDIENGSIDDLKVMTDDTLEAWRLCELASVQAAELADYAQSLRSSASTQAATMSYTSSSPARIGLFTMVVYAAEENAAVKWAKELTEKYDSYPAGQKVKQLAENLGTDAKKAYAQLKMAQNILEGEAYSAEGDTMQSFENAAMATKTACKTGLYIGGVVAGGGVANGILEAGGMIIGGVDTIVDIASTGSTIICGENSKITMAANDFKDFMGPISSAAGGVNVLTGGIKFAGDAADKIGSIGKLSYIGESLLDLVRDGKIMGGLITVGENGETTVTMTEIDVEGKTPEEIEKELENAGLSLPQDEEAKTAVELAEELEEEYYYTEEELNEVIESLRNLLYDMFLNSEEEPSETPPTQEPPEESAVPPVVSGGLSIDEVVGSYHVALIGTDTEGTWLLAKKGDSQIVDETGDMVYDYDPKTGIATSSYENEAGKGTTELIFTAEDGKISLSGSWRYSNEVNDETTIFNYKGTKTD
jgi:hypothetical protein